MVSKLVKSNMVQIPQGLTEFSNRRGLLEKANNSKNAFCIVWCLDLATALFNMCSPLNISLETTVNLGTYDICEI